MTSMTSFERSLHAVPSLIVRDSAGSTNADLALEVRRLDASDSPAADFTTMVTDNQTAGRGRLDRSWVAPAGSSLASSVLVRVDGVVPVETLGWLPLLAGLAMTRAVDAVLPGASGLATLKWPNDVQIDGRKVCGILCELIPGIGVIVGAGLNVLMTPEQLPVPTATSLRIAGAEPDAELPDRALAAYLTTLQALVGRLRDGHGDEQLSGIRDEVLARCSTIGRPVRVELPGGAVQHGTAVGIDLTGRLEVRDDSDTVHTVAAGDIIHLR
jgi:BirA family biotin operon repressor/biotin-[acetyl-CoA-carboxylase] ligase